METKPTTKMKKGISLIESTLGIKFKGSSYEEASSFLKENLPKLDGVDFRESKKPSDKQLKFIALIESTLKVSYEGKTMKDASDFISLYKPKYDKIIKERKKNNE